MAQVFEELLLKLGVDEKDFVKGLSEAQRRLNETQGGFTKTQATIVSFNQALELAQKGFNALSSVASSTIAVLQRGDQINSLTLAFKAFQEQAGRTADEGFAKLRESTKGLLSDFDLLSKANLASSLGITPELFQKLAESADALGDAIGIDATEALNKLTDGFGKNQERALKSLGLFIDSAKAQKEYAEKLGTTAEKLTDHAKRLAFQEAAAKALNDRMKQLGEGTVSAGENASKVGVAWKNLTDRFAAALDKNTDLAESFDLLAATISKIDPQPLVDLFNIIVSATPGVIQKIDSLVTGLGLLAGSDPELKQLSDLRIELERLEKFQQSSLFPSGFDSRIQSIKEERQLLIEKRSARELEQRDRQQILRELNEYGNTNIRIQNETKAAQEELIKEDKAAQQAKEEAAKQYSDQIKQYQAEILKQQMEDNKQYEEDVKRIFQESANFFSDALYNAMTGAAFDAKDIMLRILAGVAGGFLAELTGGLGSGLGSLQGLGQVIGQALAGGANPFAGLLGGAAGGAIGPVASGDAYGAALAGGSGAGFGSILSGLGPSLASVGAVGLGAYAVSSALGVIQNGPSAAPFGFQRDILEGTGFWGSTDPERLARRGLRGALQQTPLGQDLSFLGSGGRRSIFDSDYNVDFGQKGIGQTVGLVDPIAQAFTGGDDKLASDLAGMFTNAVHEAGSFNETLVNTQALLDGLGTTAPELKNEITNLFLEGKISLEEFSAGISNLNILAQEDLIGPNSVSDAIQIMSKNIQTAPRVALKGLELAFKEMKEVGIDTSTEIHDYLMDRFGPDVVRIFDQLAAAGIDTWEEIANATADQVALIFNVLSPLEDALQDTFNTGANAADGFTDSVNEAISASEALKRVNPLGQNLGSTKSRATNLNAPGVRGDT